MNDEFKKKIEEDLIWFETKCPQDSQEARHIKACLEWMKNNYNN